MKKKSMQRSSFITFEGINGSGKSTQARLLYERLKIKNEVILTKEPSDDNFMGNLMAGMCSGNDINARSVSQIVREIVKKKEYIDPVTELVLIYAARREHVQNLILPSIQKGINVICDRYYESSVVYLAREIGRYMATCLVEKLHEQLIPGNLMPDITILLDIDENVAFNRIKKRAEDRGEEEYSKFDKVSVAKLLLLRQMFNCMFDSQAGKHKIFLIDATHGDEQAIHASVIELLTKQLVRE